MTEARTVAIAELKAHLSAEIKRAREGETITILDHRKPVARLVGIDSGIRLTRRSKGAYDWPRLEPLVTADISRLIDEERADAW